MTTYRILPYVTPENEIDPEAPNMSGMIGERVELGENTTLPKDWCILMIDERPYAWRLSEVEEVK